MLRTRAPLSWEASSSIPSDLHVLGLPLAFILSQDQTLHCKMFCLNPDPTLLKIEIWLFVYLYTVFSSYIWSLLSLLIETITLVISPATLTCYFLKELYRFPISVQLLYLSPLRCFEILFSPFGFFNCASGCRLRFAYSVSSFSLLPFSLFPFRLSAFQLRSVWECKGRHLFDFSKK